MKEFTRRDIDIIRARIETADLELSGARRDHAVKKREYEEAARLLAQKEQEKALLVGHLSIIILENEKRRDAKLRQLMEKLEDGAGAASSGAGAIASAQPRFAGFE